ncbi:copper amine oxidase N-terminal domain-containing protein [Sedimentibacter sp. MB31-C6]|uniref:copper amine oxidase N-terminal domain-containing protein n=1 Tax=Sedimentibacter sp. MB31-C6 TaxID=3109366 RepID=UPI002DDD54CC|nr:copper amine oxidase N-terminal domain-containing protein [Sedimentibacter sp. MB36-C1]WSI03568.1 copper amine oxidase N-terminal domain-containing protein [Sedimentibacter sp. MB36-C1]
MKKHHIYLMIINAIILSLIYATPSDALENDIINKEIRISINGTLIDTAISKPYMNNETNELMIPIRKVLESLEFDVIWLDESREVYLELGNDKIKIKIDENTYQFQNDITAMNDNFEIIEGRSFATSNFFEKVLNVNIDYHKNNGFVIISEKEPYYLEKNEIDKVDRKLWDDTIKTYLSSELWTDRDAYDAGHYLMIPLHTAFKYNEEEWKNQFSEHFHKFVEEYKSDTNNIVKGRIDRLQYMYLASQFVVLCENTNNSYLIPDGLVDILNNEIYDIWINEPAWQWGRDPFEGGMKERLNWKLNNKYFDKSYYKAIIDEEFFTLAIAADLYTSENLVRGTDNSSKFKSEIMNYVQIIFEQEGIFREDGTWLFQPGVRSQHNDYIYAGNIKKSNNIKPSPIENIASDTSHSHRFPLWINSFINAYESNGDSEKVALFLKVRNGLEKQFYENVIVKPTEEFNGYRTNNFMDGNNGIYRWNYPTQGQGNGYGPYELSGTLTLGWWSLLKSERINQVYYEMASKFPLTENVINVYVGPNTTRDRHDLVTMPNSFYNGVTELICRLASKIY